MKLVVAGGSGFLGQVLRRYFTEAGHEVYTLTRRPGHARGPGGVLAWDGRTPGPWAAHLEGADVLINLSGKSVDCRYTKANQRAIYSSRLESTRMLGEAVAACAHPPRLWMNASSGTIYRHAEDRNMDEPTGEIGEGFSVEVCQRWEQTFFDSPLPGSVRRVALRTAIVLGRGGGALTPMRVLARLGFGGRQGNGRQYVSWLHEADFARMADHIIRHETIAGTVNLAAPAPVLNAEFMHALRRACGMPLGLPLPAWLLEAGAAIIRTETELVLKSRRVIPVRLLESGYEFAYPDLAGALKDLLGAAAR